MTASIGSRTNLALLLMEQVLRDGGALAPEYPLVFEESMPGRIISIEEDGEVRSACAVLSRELITSTATIRAGLIGSVATHPDHRGRGLASRVLATAEEELRADGCLFSLLWADEPLFYAKRGYQPIGCEHDFTVPAHLAPKLPPCDDVRVFEERDVDSIHGLYDRHVTRVVRTLSETRSCLRTPGMETLVKDNAGQVTAYACIGRGADLQGVVHEWAGRPEDLGALLNAALRRRAMQGAKDLVVMAPPCAREHAKYLRKLGARSKTGVLGMAKLLSLPALCDLVAWFLGPDGNVRIDMRPAQRTGGEPGLRIQGPNMALLFDARQMFRILFAPQADRAEVQYLERALGLPLESLPLCPFVWGLDSI